MKVVDNTIRTICSLCFPGINKFCWKYKTGGVVYYKHTQDCPEFRENEPCSSKMVERLEPPQDCHHDSEGAGRYKFVIVRK